MKTNLKLCSVLALLFILMLGSCDSDNNSNAQDMGEEPMADECPCFTLGDLETLGMQSTNIQCSIEGLSLLLTFNSQDMPEIATGCLINGGCSCQSSFVFPGGSMAISEEEYTLCFQNMLNAMIMFNIDETKLETCVITGS